MDYGKLQIAKFDPTNMVPNPAIVIIAKRGTGKSVMAKDLLYHLRKMPGGVIISPTDKLNGEYKKFFPDIYIHYEITEEILAKIMLRQKEMMEKKEQRQKRGRNIDARAVLLMDDCLSSKKEWSKFQQITEILLNGRHFHLTYILTMQEPLGLLPNLRSNFDYIFLLKENSAINKKKLWLNYASMFPNLQAFEKVLAKVTEGYCSLVINNRTCSDDISKQIFWYKASSSHDFIFGCREFRHFHDKYYDRNYKSKNHEALRNAIMGMSKKRNEIEIKVQKL